MKALVFVALFSTTFQTAVAAPATLLSWSFSDRNCKVELTVDTDGKVVHTQTCAAKTPPVTTIPEQGLSAPDLATLTSAINLAGEGPFTKHDPQVTAQSPYAGQLLALTDNGLTVISAFSPPSAISTGVALVGGIDTARNLMDFVRTQWSLTLPPVAD